MASPEPPAPRPTPGWPPPRPWRWRLLALALAGAGLAAKLLALLWLGASPGPAAAANAEPAPGALPPEVRAELQRARIPPEALSVVLHELGGAGDGGQRLRWQPHVPLNPASLAKLLTTAAALDLLGPAHTWATPVWLAGPVNEGVLEGHLHIRGSGDPLLVLERVWLLLRRVQAAGVREIRGDIVLDSSAFAPGEGQPGDFDGEPLRPYNVRPDALLLAQHAVIYSFTPDPAAGVARVRAEPALAGAVVDASVPLAAGPCTDWRRALQAEFRADGRTRFAGRYPAACGELAWPVADPDPASFNARLLEALWRSMGGSLAGRARPGPAPAAPPSFELRSPPLAEAVRQINKFSNNVMAQQLFLSLPLALDPTGTAPSTPEVARELLQRWLAERIGSDEGADPALSWRVDNGSGLSRQQRVSAAQLARLLVRHYDSPTMPELMASLPISGVDGTLRRSRAGGAAQAGRAHLKTGSLRDVNGIAGYVLSQGGRRYVLVAVVQHANAAAARPALDALVQWALRDAPPR